MRIVTRVLLFALFVTLLPAGEKWSWPPYEKSAREFFADKKDQFEEIRQNMVADNVAVVDGFDGLGMYDGCAGLDCPVTISEQAEELQAKYRLLIGERSIFKYTLFEGKFEVGGLPSQSAQGGDFFLDFVWSENEVSIPHCDEKKARLPMCGRCYEDLDPNWYMYWQWYPKDLGPDWDGRTGEGLPTHEENMEQYEIALNECSKAGWEEMGLGLDAE